jgi:hypothetical protein
VLGVEVRVQANHYHSHCRLGKFRDWMYMVKHTAVIGLNMLAILCIACV